MALNIRFGCGKVEIRRMWYRRLFEIFRNSLYEVVTVEVIKSVADLVHWCLLCSSAVARWMVFPVGGCVVDVRVGVGFLVGVLVLVAHA